MAYEKGSIIIKRIKQQRNHLGGHLKNVIVHLDDVHARILDECRKSRRNRNYSKKMLIRAIEGIIGYSHRWSSVPKAQALQFHPLEQYEDKDWWEKKINRDEYFISEKKLDEIYPNQKEFSEFLDTENSTMDEIVQLFEKKPKGIQQDMEC